MDDTVDLPGPIARSRYELSDPCEQPAAIRVLMRRVGVGELFTDVRKPGRAEQRVRHRVKHHVAIAVSQQSHRRFDGYASQDQRASHHQSMDIVPDSDPATDVQYGLLARLNGDDAHVGQRTL